MLVENLPVEQLENVIVSQTGQQITVRSFTNPDEVTYNITTTDDGDMQNCTCPDHQNSGTLCKHMFAVNQFLGVPFPPFTPSHSSSSSNLPVTSERSTTTPLQPLFEK
ncbi:hypothetical protein DM01DRAFT_1336022 [Hesseltinella vesiculosa]|uniref:SWIM-type domain-containing protein n=1 Tax=Hesseltinella vesiculosa TaxID=101127 RepID=A0A1X2GGM3_9FUNG|nr:hypothetical protein DM01DRAFT_1336022 [Hesseltinella vesiculosa]